ncbi:MAG: single-stranded DNA-binding protein [Thermodesulfobacteriota bacterium]
MNKAILIGNLGKDIEIRHTTNDHVVTNLSLATTERIKDQSQTEWHRVIVYGKLAELCGSYLKKGEQVYVEGKSRKKVWEKDGIKRYTTEIVASQIVMLGSGSNLGVNKAIFIGRLGIDPEIRYTKDGLAVANLSLATNEKNGSGFETQWHRIIALGKLAEICERYLEKGRQICIEGRFRTRSWKKDGVTRSSTEVIAAHLEMLGSRNADTAHLEEPIVSSETLGTDCIDDIPF